MPYSPLESVSHCRHFSLYCIYITTHIRFKSALVTDKRVRVMNEIISGIRVIKMYAWENAFRKLITKLRRYNFLVTVRYIACVAFTALFLLTQQRIQDHSARWTDSRLQFGLDVYITHSSHVFHLCYLHCNWWWANSQESLHNSLSAHRLEIDHCALLHTECASHDRRTSGSGQAPGEWLILELLV